MTWEPVSGVAALIETPQGLLLAVNSDSFGPARSVEGLAAICFAYGLDLSELFAPNATTREASTELVRQCCAAMRREVSNLGQASLAQAGLIEAKRLCPAQVFADIQRRFDSRVAALRTHVAH